MLTFRTPEYRIDFHVRLMVRRKTALGHLPVGDVLQFVHGDQPQVVTSSREAAFLQLARSQERRLKRTSRQRRAPPSQP